MLDHATSNKLQSIYASLNSSYQGNASSVLWREHDGVVYLEFHKAHAPQQLIWRVLCEQRKRSLPYYGELDNIAAAEDPNTPTLPIWVGDVWHNNFGKNAAGELKIRDYADVDLADTLANARFTVRRGRNRLSVDSPYASARQSWRIASSATGRQTGSGSQARPCRGR
jgi:hypothetical protein